MRAGRGLVRDGEVIDDHNVALAPLVRVGDGRVVEERREAREEAVHLRMAPRDDVCA